MTLSNSIVAVGRRQSKRKLGRTRARRGHEGQHWKKWNKVKKHNQPEGEINKTQLNQLLTTKTARQKRGNTRIKGRVRDNTRRLLFKPIRICESPGKTELN